jgi:serine/threonine protein kinase
MPKQEEALEKIKDEVVRALKLLQKRHTGANLEEARRFLKEAAEAIEKDNFTSAISLVQKAQLAANPTTEYLLGQAKSLESQGNTAYRKGDFTAAVEFWQKSLKEYQSVRELANRRGEQEVVDKVAATMATIEQDIDIANVEKANREVVHLAAQANQIVDEAKSRFDAKEFDAAAQKFETALEKYESASKIAHDFKFEDKTRLHETATEMQASIEACRLGQGEKLLEIALKEKVNQQETACLEALKFLESFSSADPKYGELKKKAYSAIARARMEVGTEFMAGAETLLNKGEYYNAKEEYRKAQDHFEKVRDFTVEQLLEEEKAKADSLIDVCAANIKACTDSLIGREKVATGGVIKVEELRRGIVRQQAGPESPYTEKMALLTKEYEIIKWLKPGGFGDVCVARNKEGMIVALKLPRELEKSEDVFFRELDIWKRLNHRNIVKLIRPRFYPTPLLEIEYVDGGSLSDLLGGVKPVSIEDACRILFDIARGLEYAHSKHNIIHADLKPSNILLTRTQEAKITDWGLSKIATSSTGVHGYTPGYAAPEQITKNKADKKTDVFQLGIIFYEMLSRDNPFAHGSRAERDEKILNLVPDEPSKYKPQLEPLDGLILSCLQKDPGERPTIREIREAVYKYMKECHDISLHLSEPMDTQIKILCQHAMFAAKQNDHASCIVTLKSLRSKVSDSARRESILNLIGQMEFRQKEGMEIPDDILNDIDALLRWVQYGET